MHTVLQFRVSCSNEISGRKVGPGRKSSPREKFENISFSVRTDFLVPFQDDRLYSRKNIVRRGGNGLEFGALNIHFEKLALLYVILGKNIIQRRALDGGGSRVFFVINKGVRRIFLGHKECTRTRDPCNRFLEDGAPFFKSVQGYVLLERGETLGSWFICKNSR